MDDGIVPFNSLLEKPNAVKRVNNLMSLGIVEVNELVEKSNHTS